MNFSCVVSFQRKKKKIPYLSLPPCTSVRNPSRKIRVLLTYLTWLILSFHIFCVVIEFKTECELSFEDRESIQIFVIFAKTKALASTPRLWPLMDLPAMQTANYFMGKICLQIDWWNMSEQIVVIRAADLKQWLPWLKSNISQWSFKTVGGKWWPMRISGEQMF